MTLESTCSQFKGKAKSLKKQHTVSLLEPE